MSAQVWSRLWPLLSFPGGGGVGLRGRELPLTLVPLFGGCGVETRVPFREAVVLPRGGPFGAATPHLPQACQHHGVAGGILAYSRTLGTNLDAIDVPSEVDGEACCREPIC